jgi:hypothetical protein
MFYTVYLDESGTHAGSPVTIMGGFIGAAEQWSKFESELKNLQAAYGFSVFHGKEFRQKSGEFKGWSDEKCLSLVADLTRLVSDHLTAGAFMPLPNARYKNEYYDVLKKRKVATDTAYGLCFRACVVHFLEVVGELDPSTGAVSTLNVVIESGHRNTGDAERIFAEMKESIRVNMGIEPLGSLTIAGKENALLMVADFLVYSMYLRDTVNQGSAIVANPGDFPPPEAKGPLTELRLEPDALASLPDHFHRLKVERKAARRAAERGGEN